METGTENGNGANVDPIILDRIPIKLLQLIL